MENLSCFLVFCFAGTAIFKRYVKSLQDDVALDDVESSEDGDGDGSVDCDADRAEDEERETDEDPDEGSTLAEFFAARFRNNMADEILGSVAGDSEEADERPCTPDEQGAAEPDMSLELSDGDELSALSDELSDVQVEKAATEAPKKMRGRPLSSKSAPQILHELQTRAACDTVLEGAVLKM